MRILHVWDQASVACVLAKYQRLQGHDSKVILLSDNDKYGIYKFYKHIIQGVKFNEYIDSCIREANLSDIVHVHSRYDLVPNLRRKCGKSKKIILHYHGSDLRGSKMKILYTSGVTNFAKSLIDRAYLGIFRKSMHKKAQKMADAVLVAAPDLLQYLEKATYLPIPVDTDHFKIDNHTRPNKKEALTMHNTRLDVQLSLQYCRRHNIALNIDVHDRTKCPIMYEDMPAFLKTYCIYMDVRFVDGKILDHLCTTAEQSLACGLKVLDYQLKYRQGLPSELDGKNVASRLSSIYSM